MEFFAQAGKYAAVSTNPYVYESGYFFIVLCVLEFLFKVVFSILLMTNDDFQDCSLPVWLFIASIFLSFYFLLFIYTKRDLTIKQRFGLLHIFIQPVVYVAALNVASKLYAAFTLARCVTPPGTATLSSLDVASWTGWMILLILASVAIDCALLWIGTHYDVQTYDPNKGNFMFKKTRTFEERDGPLSIIESGSFRIIVQNLSPESFNEKTLEIKRKVGALKEEVAEVANAKHETFAEQVKFTIKLDQPINPGHMVSVIPETHNEHGAIKVLGFRAFAPQVNEVVQTRIRSGKLLSRLHENYMKIVELEAVPLAVPVPEARAK